MEKYPCQKIFLDDFDVSEALVTSLKKSKKLENYTLVVTNDEHFKRGEDFRKVKKVVDDVHKVFPLTFQVQTYFFSSGENCYTMGLPEKIQYCELKKPKIASLIEETEYDMALKLIEFVLEMTERQDKHNKSKEEIEEVLKSLFQYRRSALFNKTLCQWKLSRWIDLIKTAELILAEIEPDNPKILYRVCLAYHQKKEYHKVIEKCRDLWNKNENASTEFPELAALYTKCEGLEANVKSKERNMYKDLLQSLTS